MLSKFVTLNIGDKFRVYQNGYSKDVFEKINPKSGSRAGCVECNVPAEEWINAQTGQSYFHFHKTDLVGKL
jgi:hypothetical protein